jgi:hypothetical protein
MATDTLKSRLTKLEELVQENDDYCVNGLHGLSSQIFELKRAMEKEKDGWKYAVGFMVLMNLIIWFHHTH